MSYYLDCLGGGLVLVSTGEVLSVVFPQAPLLTQCKNEWKFPVLYNVCSVKAHSGWGAG